MKQTSKLTRRQRDFLNAKGVKNTKAFRFCEENPKVYVFYNTEKQEQVVYNKE